MKSTSQVALLTALLSSVIASPLSAEEAQERLIGQRVRVTAAATAFTGTIVGTLVKDGPDNLVLVDPGTGAITELPLASVTQIEVSHPRTRAKTGMLIGIGVGALGGVIVGSGYSEVGCGDPGGPYVDCEASVALGIGVGVAGAAVWGVVGHWLGGKSKVDVWTNASAGRLKVSLTPLRGGGRAAFSLSF